MSLLLYIESITLDEFINVCLFREPILVFIYLFYCIFSVFHFFLLQYLLFLPWLWTFIFLVPLCVCLDCGFEIFLCFLRWAYVLINFSLGTAFAGIPKILNYYFYFYFSLGSFKFPLWLFCCCCWPLDFLVACYLASPCLCFSQFFPCSFIPLWSEEMPDTQLNLLKFTETCSVACDLSWRMSHHCIL